MLLQTWQFWAILSACFAALTAVFAKIGVEGIDPDLATFIRTLVVVAVLVLILTAGNKWRGIGSISGRTLGFLVFSGLATGASWLCYFRALQIGDAAQVAPVDKLSVVLVAVFGVLFLSERLSATNWAGVLLIAGGALLVAYRG